MEGDVELQAAVPRCTTTMLAEPELGATDATCTYPLEHLDCTVTRRAVAVDDVMRLLEKEMVSLEPAARDDEDDVIRPDMALSEAEFELAVTVPNSYA